MEEKIKVYVVCVEEDGQSGIFTEALPFRTMEEAWTHAEKEGAKFKDEYGDDVETEVQEGVSIYDYTDDYYIYITVSEHEI